MKKKFLLIICIILACTANKAQDKIITTNGDIILCRILGISSTDIHYEQKQKDGFVVGKFIPVGEVSEYRRTSASKAEKRKGFISRPQKPFRLTLSGGYARLLSSFSEERQTLSMYATSEQLDDYLNGIKNEIDLGVDFHVLLNDHFGVGVKYSLFTASTEFNCLYPVSGSFSVLNIPEYIHLRQKENIFINYVGPSLFFRQWLDSEHKLASDESLSLGYAFYNEKVFGDKYQSVYPNTLTAAGNFAGNLEIALEYFLRSSLSVSANVGYSYLSFKDFTVSQVDPSTNNLKKTPANRNKAMDMSNIHFSLGLQYYF